MTVVASTVESIGSWWEYMTVEVPEDVRERLFEHAVLVLQAVTISTLLAVGLGIAAHRWRPLRAPVLGLASVLLTIPSLAMFTLFIPIVGLGSTPALIALVLYALLPVLRNTVTGLDGVDPAVVESARGVGYSKRQTLVHVELPLAWPVISTGIRVSLLLATGIAAIATLVGGGGLGEFIKDGLPRYPLGVSVEQIWTGTVLTMVLALVFDAIFGLVRYVTTPRGIRN
ncbi:ABC transporter permease [soil metagenome]